MLASLSLLMVSAVAMPQLDVELPKKDDVWVSMLTEEYIDPESGTVDQTFVYRVEKKVIQRIRGGLAIESKRTLIENKMGDTKVPLPPGITPLIESYAVDIYGLRTKVAEGAREQQEQRIAQLTDLFCPERFGPNESRAAKRTLQESDPRKEVRLEFTKSDWQKDKKTYHCSFSISDSGWPKSIDANGEGVFPEDSMIPISLTISAKNVEMPGGSGDAYTLRIKLVREEKKG